MSPNWHGVIAGGIAAVNPPTAITLHTSTGFTIAPDGTPVPGFTAAPGRANIEALDAKELQHLAEIGIEGVVRKAYVFGALSGLIRVAETGGDFIVITAGAHTGTWKVVRVFETWPGWAAAAIQLQVEGV